MNHEILKERIPFFHDPELPAEERLEIAVHLQECEECAGVLKRWEAFSSALKTAPGPQAAPFFVNSVMSRLEDLEKVSAPAFAGPPFLNWLLPTLGY